MKLSTLSTSLLLSIFASAAFAQAPAAAPAGTTGMCKDGSYSNAATKAGACSGHKGIKTWYVAEPTKAEKKAAEKAEADQKAAAKAEKKAEAKAEKKADKAAEAKIDKKAEVKAEAKAEAKADKSALEKKGDIKEEKKSEPMKAAAPAPMPAAAPAVKAAPATAPAATKTATAAAAPAAGASANSVWVNTDTKVYHCPGTRFYGKTKSGAYMSEAEATAKGSRADHGKACGK